MNKKDSRDFADRCTVWLQGLAKLLEIEEVGALAYRVV
jgi:hypothetical protein